MNKNNLASPMSVFEAKNDPKKKNSPQKNFEKKKESPENLVKNNNEKNEIEQKIPESLRTNYEELANNIVSSNFAPVKEDPEKVEKENIENNVINQSIPPHFSNQKYEDFDQKKKNQEPKIHFMNKIMINSKIIETGIDNEENPKKSQNIENMYHQFTDEKYDKIKDVFMMSTNHFIFLTKEDDVTTQKTDTELPKDKIKEVMVHVDPINIPEKDKFDKEGEDEDSPFYKAYENSKNFIFYQQKIEKDIYIMTSYFVMIFFPCLLLFICYIFQNLYRICFPSKDKNENEPYRIKKLKFALISFVSIPFLMLILVILSFPGIFVILTQYYCVLFLRRMPNEDQTSSNNNLITLELLLVAVLSFMVSQETSQAINTCYYLSTLMSNSIKTNPLNKIEENGRKKKNKVQSLCLCRDFFGNFDYFPIDPNCCCDYAIKYLHFHYFKC